MICPVVELHARTPVPHEFSNDTLAASRVLHASALPQCGICLRFELLYGCLQY